MPLAKRARNGGGQYASAGRHKRAFRATSRLRKSAVPARFGTSKSVYRSSKLFSKRSQNVAETKLKALRNVNNYMPSLMDARAGENIYGTVMVVGTTPPGISSYPHDDLGGVHIAPGTGKSERIGQSVYLQRTTQSFAIETTTETGNAPLMEFRCIHVKARRATAPSGSYSIPWTDLFLDQAGASYGLSNGFMYTMDYFMSMINLDRWVVYKDDKFILSTPDQPSNAAYSGKYPCKKEYRLFHPLYAKTKMSDSTNEPIDIDSTFYVITLAREVGGNTLEPKNWNVSSRGTTSYKDI